LPLPLIILTETFLHSPPENGTIGFLKNPSLSNPWRKVIRTVNEGRLKKARKQEIKAWKMVKLCKLE
jgi:hypothetical protein